MNIPAKQKIILIVEDDPDIASIMEILLEEKEYCVHVLQSVDPGRALALGADLIVMDQKLKGVLGSELCMILKEDEKCRDIPIILCSAVNNLPFLRDNCHADAFISKPFGIDEFMGLVERLTG